MLIQRRFVILWGVARECLCPDAVYVDERTIEHRRHVVGKNDKVKRMLLMTDAELVFHPAFHLTPDPANPSKQPSQDASEYTRRMVVNQLALLPPDVFKVASRRWPFLRGMILWTRK